MNDRLMYDGHYIKIFEKDDRGEVFEKAVLRDCVSVIPFVDPETILLIRENRIQEDPPVRLKLVTGFLEPGLSVEENANKEMQEEIGKKAGRLFPFLVHRLTGSINQTNTYVIALDLADAKLPNPDGEETILEVVPTRLDEMYRLLTYGRFTVSATAFALLKLCLDVREGRGLTSSDGRIILI